MTTTRSGDLLRRPRRHPTSHAPHRPSGILRALPYLIPALAVLVLFRVVPVFYSIYLSTNQVPDYGPSKLVGLTNYRVMLDDQTLHAALKNDLFLLLSFPLWIALPVLVAVLIHERIWGWRVFLAVFFIPAVLSPVVIGMYYTSLLSFNGPVNQTLTNLGLESLTRGWLVDLHTAFPVLLAVWLWSITGLGMLFFLNGLGNIDPAIWEAASIDGAGWWARMRYITVPLLRPVFEFWSIFVMILVFSGLFPLVNTLTNGGPGNKTMVADLYIYLTAFTGGRFSYASAIGVVLFGLVLVFVLVQLHLFRRGDRGT